MEWILRSPQMHSTFGSLGYTNADGYHINENCNVALESILHNIVSEDKYLRGYRRSISFGQNVQKDLVPLLVNTNDDRTVELLVKILMELSIPLECLLAVDLIAKTDFGRHTIFEINNLLYAIKNIFTDHRVTKVIIEMFKKNINIDQHGKLTEAQCSNIGNGLLLLRNILHIPDSLANTAGTSHVVQNQILWNMFSQSIDKILIKLMCIPEATHWSVTMIQLVALLYKDQQVATLHNLLNCWLETSLSESSEDNESNTSPPDRGRENSSPMITSDPTSDSSDIGGSGSGQTKDSEQSESVWCENVNMDQAESPEASPSCDNPSPCNDSSPCEPKTSSIEPCVSALPDETPPICPLSLMPKPMPTPTSAYIGTVNTAKRKHEDTSASDEVQTESESKNTTVSKETSDCGYGTQIENQESVSTSSNDDEPAKKPIHQKPRFPKQKPNTKKTIPTVQDKKRKKIIKRAKATIINVQGLSRNTPTDEDISNVLKEFTVDFLLKGYNSLVKILHSQILSNERLEIDTSHFFWLLTYFLKFTTQIELDPEHVRSVLTFDVIAYLTSEGVNLCEQFELSIKLDGNDLKPIIRRLHLVVTAIREFVQAVELYKKQSFLTDENKDSLFELQIQICEMEDLRCLMVLLLKHYNPNYHKKQYLQDLIVTNHILLLFMDCTINVPEYKGKMNMVEHMRQFATPDMMIQYGLLLEDYNDNGEFVNDCVFTVMHHVGGDLASLISLFQPRILKTFTSIWKSDFEICEDWADLIEYVINTFIKKPQTFQKMSNFNLEMECLDEDKNLQQAHSVDIPDTDMDNNYLNRDKSEHSLDLAEMWTPSELSSLGWYYIQCNTSKDVISDIVGFFKEDGTCRSREAVIKALYKQNIINADMYEHYLEKEIDNISNLSLQNIENKDNEIGTLCQKLIQDGNTKGLQWVQKALLNTCYVKIYLDKKRSAEVEQQSKTSDEANVTEGNNKSNSEQSNMVVMSAVAYHNTLMNRSVPLVPWNHDQSAFCKDLKFLQLVHKLGFNMPVDSGKLFIRIPYFWTTDVIYDVAEKILPIDTNTLNFSLSDLAPRKSMEQPCYPVENRVHLAPKIHPTINVATDHVFHIPKRDHISAVQFTPNVISELMPTVLKMNIPHAAASPDIDEDYHSVCETTSVVTNLTHLYVSDEEDKGRASDSDCDTMAKRPRVHLCDY